MRIHRVQSPVVQPGSDAQCGRFRPARFPDRRARGDRGTHRTHRLRGARHARNARRAGKGRGHRHQRPDRHAQSASAGGERARDPRRQHRCRRLRCRNREAARSRHAGNRCGRAHCHPRPERRSHPLYPRGFDLYERSTLGRRAFASRRHAPRARAGAAHARAALGAGDRRLDLGAVRGTALPDARRDQCRDRRHAVYDHAPVRPGLAQPLGRARARLDEGHAQHVRRRDRARRLGQPHGAGDVDDEPREPGLGVAAHPEAFPRGPDSLDTPLYARAQSPGRHQRDRRGRRRPELSGKLRCDREARCRRTDDAADRLHALRAGARQGTRQLRSLVQAGEVRTGERLLPHDRHGRIHSLRGGRRRQLRQGLSGTARGRDGKKSLRRSEVHRRAGLAVPPAHQLRRQREPRARRARAGEPRDSVEEPALGAGSLRNPAAERAACSTCSSR